MTDIERYEQMSDELAENTSRHDYVDTTNDPEFLQIKKAALQKQKALIDKQIDGIDQLINLALV